MLVIVQQANADASLRRLPLLMVLLLFFASPGSPSSQPPQLQHQRLHVFVNTSVWWAIIALVIVVIVIIIIIIIIVILCTSSSVTSNIISISYTLLHDSAPTYMTDSAFWMLASLL